MANYVTEIGEVSKIKLHGHIDASIAPALMEELKPLIAQKDKIKKLVFFADELEYIASAGIRAVVFAKQKLGGNPEIDFVNCAKDIYSVFEMTGIQEYINFIEK